MCLFILLACTVSWCLLPGSPDLAYFKLPWSASFQLGACGALKQQSWRNQRCDGLCLLFTCLPVEGAGMGSGVYQSGVLQQKNFLLFHRPVLCPCLGVFCVHWSYLCPVVRVSLLQPMAVWRALLKLGGIPFQACRLQRQQEPCWLHGFAHWKLRLEPSIQVVVGLDWVGLAAQSSESSVLYWKL